MKSLGNPHLRIADLRLWVHGRQFPEASDYWDGNWLRATAYYLREDSSVRIHGSFIHLGEVRMFMEGCKEICDALVGVAKLDCIEPDLYVEVTASPLGRIRIETQITPEHLSETHTYNDELDQSYLPNMISECEGILKEYPLRNAEALSS